MSEKVKITIKCRNCGKTELNAEKGIAYVSSTLICTTCGDMAEVTITKPPEQSGMTFMEAVEAMKKGKRVRREGWQCNSIHIGTNPTVKDGILWENENTWVARTEDVCLTDWEIVK